MTNTSIIFDKEYANEFEAMLELNNITIPEICKVLRLEEDTFNKIITKLELTNKHYHKFYQFMFDGVESFLENQKRVMKMFPRLEIYNGEVITELKALRVRNGLNAKDVHEIMGISSGLYSNRENGKRGLKVKDYEQFYYDVDKAIEKSIDMKREEILSIELEDIKDTDTDLDFLPVTDEVIEQAMFSIAGGNSLVKASIGLGVNSDELKKRLDIRLKEVPEMYSVIYHDSFANGLISNA